LHAVFALPHLHTGVDLMHLVLTDKVADGRVGNHDLQGKASTAALLGDQGLGQNPLQDKGKLGPDLRLLIGWKDVQDPVDGLDTVVCVKCPEHKVTRFRHGKGRFDGLEVSHLPDEYDVGVLTQDGFEGSLECGGVGPNLPLVDHAALVGVEELDGIFNSDDVLVPRSVDTIDHGRQCRGLSAPGRTGDKDKSFGPFIQFLHNLGQLQAFEGEDLEGDRPDSSPH